MINGLGLFAALGAGEPEAAPQPQAGDPALFAAALVAALGLKQPVQVIEPVEAPLAEQEVTEENAEEAPVEGEEAPVIHARVTPDAEAIEETKTLDTVLRSTEKKGETKSPEPPKATVQAKAPDPDVEPVKVTKVGAPEAQAKPAAEPVKGKAIDLTIDEPARPARVAAKAPIEIEAPETEKQQRSQEPEQTQTQTQGQTQSTPAVQAVAPLVVPPAQQSAAPTEKPAPESAPRQHATPRVEAPVIASAPAPLAKPQAPVIKSDAPIAPEVQAEAPAPAPPQSDEERTSRAIAENTRLGRQLAELLGEADVTEFKVQLAPRRPGKSQAPSAPVQAPSSEIDPPSAPVVWRRVVPTESGDTISGQMLPRHPMREPKTQAPEGSFAREMLQPRPLIQQGGSDALTLSGVTSRSEIVRMVANASRAMSPTLTQAEASPAVAKAPAPSITPSLPVARQEIPESEPRFSEASGEDPKRRPASEASSNDASAANATSSANYSAVQAPRSESPDTRDVREARNLPSHGSTDEPAAGSADRVTLQVADDEGRQTRIRVSVTGNQIRAVITPPDSASARQLEQRMDQLHETLVRAGFADPKLVVRSAPESMSDVATMANAASSNQDLRSAAPAGRDQPSGEQRQGNRQGQREQDRGDGHRHPQGHSRERDPRDRRR